MELKNTIKVIEDFPNEGISFKDITPLLADKNAFQYAVNKYVEYLKDKDIDIIVGPEARGFIFGVAVAYAMNLGFVPIRKEGALPRETLKYKYDLEYGEDVLEIHKDAIKKGMKVAIVDDLLATGGTMKVAVNMMEELGAEIVSIAFLIELKDLNGREKLKNYDVHSILEYNR